MNPNEKPKIIQGLSEDYTVPTEMDFSSFDFSDIDLSNIKQPSEWKGIQLYYKVFAIYNGLCIYYLYFFINFKTH